MQNAITRELSPRERLHHIIDKVDNEKVNAMLTLFGEWDEWEYPDELKAELDKDFEDYQNGAKTYSREDVQKEMRIYLNTQK